MFETQKSGNKTSSGDIGLNISTLASLKVGQDQMSGWVSVPCRHATTVADALLKPMVICDIFCICVDLWLQVTYGTQVHDIRPLRLIFNYLL